MLNIAPSWRAVLHFTAAVLITGTLSPRFASAQQEATASNPALRWEQKIQEFEKADRENPPTPGQILFIGSSSIVRWKLDDSFPDLSRKTINRGFGGSYLSDSVYFFERIVPQQKPSTIVVYAGDNDLARGQTVRQVHDSFRKFVALTREHLPGTQIIFIAIKPSGSRWKIIDQVREANALIAADCNAADDLIFLDIAPPMLGEDGKPRTELFVKDQLHLSPEGYELWSSLLRPHLEK